MTSPVTALPTSPRTRWISALVLLAVASALLLLNLGDRALIGSEDRWAEIARNILLRHDWFHPVINGEIYFDKPLLSYWLIVLASYVTQTLDEFTVRVPCAAAGVLALYCTYVIAVRWYNRATAWLAVWIMGTAFGFLFWTHTASAEMTNVAMTMAAVAWFVVRQQQRTFVSYAVFYVLCAIGSQMKGLTAVVVPLLVLVPWLLREKRWQQHLNLHHLAAIGVSAALFAIPYLGATHEALPQGVKEQSNHLSGIDLLIRENIVRFFHPFDHVDPWYSYFYQVPRIVFPWLFFLVAALCHYVPRYFKSHRSTGPDTLAREQRWLLETIVIIFLFFTASGSRRWYYILPILPFCSILIAGYVTSARYHRGVRIASVATTVLLTLLALLLAVLPLSVHGMIQSAPVPAPFWIAGCIASIGSVILLLLDQRHFTQLLQWLQLDSTQLPDALARQLAVSIVLMTAIFAFVIPGTDYYRQEKSFALTLADILQADDDRQASDTVVFFRVKQTTTVYYLDSPQAFPVINSPADLPTGARSVIVVAEDKDKEALFNAFPKLKDAQPLLAAKQFPEKWAHDKSALVAYRLQK